MNALYWEDMQCLGNFESNITGVFGPISQGRVLITQIISKTCMGKRLVLAALGSFSEL